MGDPRVVNEADVARESWMDPVRGEVGFRTLVGGDGGPGDFTAGVADLEPGGWLGHHRHEPAELYYVLSGDGVVVVDGEEHAVAAGTAVSIPGDSEHGIRNSGPAPLRFFYVFAVGSFEEVEYRFTHQG
jgi:mannose-6-phosphate isomerase-like protein (cupin superfamily)